MTQSSTSERKSVQAAAKAQRLADARREGVVKMLMSTPDGREWVFDLLGRCHLFGSTYTSDSRQSAFLEGERNVGLVLLADVLRICPELYLQAQRESNDRHHSDDRSAASDAADPTERSSSESPGRDLDGRTGSADDDTGVDGAETGYDPARYDLSRP